MASERTYSHAEIERYLQKQMSSSEMHAFEKAMMSDPFLADTLEGFQASDASLAKQHLSEINQHINPKKEEARVVAFGTTTKWLRIAAIFIVLVGAGIITYKIVNKPGETTEIASVENPPLPTVDSIGPRPEPLAQQSAPGKAANDNTITASPNVPKEVFTEGIAAAPLAMKSTTDTLRSTLADSSRLQADQSSTAMANAPALLEEVKAAKNRSAAAQPGDGWLKLQAYVDNEVKLAKEKNTALTGMRVELEFSVDKNGSIQDIKILNASNTEVAKIAADILRKSPRRTLLANNEKAKIVLSF